MFTGLTRKLANLPSGGLIRMFLFFLPLGFSASLVTFSHVIINSTLTRSTHPELIISSYAIAMSLLGVTERPAVLLRQTCSALVRDRISFRAITAMAWSLFAGIMVISILIAFTKVGHWLFLGIFQVSADQLPAIIHTYRILIFVSFFSGIRSLFHGIIIANKLTMWLTLGMIIRLIVMYGLSQYFILTDRVSSAMVGAIIFLAGMIVESFVAYLEGSKLLRRKLPEKLPDHPIERKGHIFHFYRPLLYSSFIAVAVAPSINAVLGKTSGMELAIASFAIAASLTQLTISFFSYMHQIVLNFYVGSPHKVFHFAMLIGFIPAILIGLLGYTPLGLWFMQSQMGVSGALLESSLHTLRVFMILAFIYPWLDLCNGMLMLKGQTKVMVWSQAANLAITLLILLVCLFTVPGWNGLIGALAQSLGLLAELVVVFYALRMMTRSPDLVGAAE